MLFINNKIAATLTFAVMAVIGLSAQTNYKLPEVHAAEHSDLIAGQQNIGNQIKDDGVQKFMDQLFAEEEEPEMDIYTEGWDSQLVNCYRNVDVPHSKVIDVSNFSMPSPGYVTSPYGYRRRFRRMHKGIDLKAQVGDTIRAAFDGKVRIAKYERRGYGYYIVMRHPNELETVYGHLSKFLVKPDQIVKAGEPIALAGNTGRSFGAHLHFETRFMGYPINPAAIFDFANQTVHTDTYTFDKNTYKQARNFDPAANRDYAAKYQKNYKPAVKEASSKAKSSSSRLYKVRKGDSLSKIASRNHTSVATICRLNGIKANATLKPGQKLKIK